jgi:hypothetical protein
MKSKFVVGAVAVVGAFAIGAPAFAAETVIVKPMVVHHHFHHHMVVVAKPVMAKPMMAKPVVAHRPMVHHGMMGVDAKERAETAKLNEQQVMMDGIQK